MPFDIQWEPRGVVVTMCGVLDSNDLAQIYQHINDDPRFDDLRWEIHDFSNVTALGYSIYEAEKYGHMDLGGAMTNPSVKLAIVSTDQEVFALSSLYHSAIAHTAWKLEAFPSVDAAREWVGAGASEKT